MVCTTNILLYHIICLALQSQVVQLRDQIKKTSSDDKLPREEPDTGDRADLTISSSDHKMTDITSQSKT